MATYIGLFKLTDRGLENVQDSARNFQFAEQHLQGMGVRVTSFYPTIGGDYDFVAIMEATSDQQAAHGALYIGLTCNVRTRVLKSFTREEFESIVSIG